MKFSPQEANHEHSNLYLKTDRKSFETKICQNMIYKNNSNIIKMY
jgi:hypothetical protein